MHALHLLSIAPCHVNGPYWNHGYHDASAHDGPHTILPLVRPWSDQIVSLFVVSHPIFYPNPKG